MPERENLIKIDSDPRAMDEEYIKVEMIIHKNEITQEDALEFIRRCNIFGMEESKIEIKEIAITGIEPADEHAELDELMSAGIKGAKSEESLDEGQDIMAQKFFEKHPMWFVVTNCPKCGTPNIEFPCKRCGYEP